METDGIVGRGARRGSLPAFARVAEGPHPGGVISDADGKVLVNLLQTDADNPLEPPFTPPLWWSPWRWPQA